MRVTKRQLKQIIQKELSGVLQEQGIPLQEAWYDTIADFDFGFGGGVDDYLDRRPFYNASAGEMQTQQGDYEPRTMRPAMDAMAGADLRMGHGVPGTYERQQGTYDPYTVRDAASDFSTGVRAVASAPLQTAEYISDRAGDLYSYLSGIDFSLGGGGGGAAERKGQELAALRQRNT